MRSPPGSYAWCAATRRRRGARRGEEREASALTRKDIIRERRTVGLPKTDTRGGRQAHIRRGTWHDVIMSASPHVTPHSLIHAYDIALHPYSLALHTPGTFACVRARCGLSQRLELSTSTMTDTHLWAVAAVSEPTPVWLHLHTAPGSAVTPYVNALCHLCHLCHLCQLSHAVGCTIYSVRLLSDLCSLDKLLWPLAQMSVWAVLHVC